MKFNEKKWSMMKLKKKQTNQENGWKQKKIAIKIIRIKFDKKKLTNSNNQGWNRKIKFNLKQSI
jgi:hypothetical protein